ncbi:MAG: tRNA 4-thiouridine(8) synthase ThiI [Clostridia bacterium]|nr:tRNA 4-thiouridine(8) synthase ThiI [Clostridia bacterium]
MKQILLLKCGELILKGLNRGKFEEKLCSTLRRRLKNVGEYDVRCSQSTVYVEPKGDTPIEPAIEVSQKVFGVVSVCLMAVCEKDMDDICRVGKEYLKDVLSNARSFRVTAKRADKRFPVKSPEIGVMVGGYLQDCYSHLKPDMENFDVNVEVNIREDHAYIGAVRLPGAGGMPTGTNGRGMLLLSGGIDSPVAGWCMAKRGIDLSAVHFFSYPYTSEEAKQKVLDLAAILGKWSGKLTVSVVPFTHIQEEIRDKCHEDYFTLVMRRMMMRIAQETAKIQNCGCLITGESLGQVASQTMEALACTNAICTEVPVFRPLIGMDKEEIIAISRRIGAFETSILPYEDCCTVFTPKHPQTKPKLENVIRQEEKLDIDALVKEALDGVERITL